MGLDQDPFLGTLVTFTYFAFALSRTLVSKNGEHILRETCFKGNGSHRGNSALSCWNESSAKVLLGFSLPPDATVLVLRQFHHSLLRNQGGGDTLHVHLKGDGIPFPANLYFPLLVGYSPRRMSLPTYFPAKTTLFSQKGPSTRRSQGFSFASGALPM